MITSSATIHDVAESDSRWQGSTFRTQVAVQTGRSLRSMVADPRAAVLGLVGPILMLVILSQVFGSIADESILPAGVRYIDYLVPAIFVTTAVSSAQLAGQGLVQDMRNGVFARLRSLPIRPFGLLVARSLADLVRYSVQLLMLLGFSVGALGFRPTNAGGLLVGLGVALLMAWALIWVFVALAAWLRSAEVLQSVGVLMFPLTFASSAFAPTAHLPTWLQVIATVNPLTYGVDALRGLSLGLATGPGAVAPAVLATLALGGVAATLGGRAFRTTGNGI